jgi:hypothetical protein
MRSESTSRPPAASPRRPWQALLALLTALLLLAACSVQDLQPGPGLPAPPTPISPNPPPPPATSQANPPPPAATNAPARPTATSGAVGQPVNQGAPAVPPFVVYSAGKLADSWEDASWGGAKFDLQSTEAPRDGHPTVKVTYGEGWGAFSVADWKAHNNADSRKYSHLHFWINGGPTGGQRIGVSLGGERVVLSNYLPDKALAANRWQEVFIPLDDLQAGGQPIGRLTFQETAGKPQSPYYLDAIEFYKDNTPPPTPILTTAQVTVDLSARRKPISPFIYGMSQAPEDVARAANITVNRMGGNPYSRYNWTLGNARNAGSDAEFRNYQREPDDPAYRQPSGLADMFFKADQRTGAATLLTVPMLGYVAKNADNSTRSTNVPQEGGAPIAPGSEAIAGYDPKANQDATSVKSYPRKGAPFQDPPDPNAGAVYQDEWINHLTRTFGKAADGGVRFYAMDNEPDLWADDTHVDVHPTRAGYDELLQKFMDYASAVKAVDPTAEVTGPVVSGWTGYWFSALDRGDDSFGTAADRAAHGGMPLIPWFLDQVHKRDQAAGRRTLDVLDIHYYPQAAGLAQDKTDPQTAALRLRSTRSLWDPTYEDESWIGRSEAKQVDLIPRMLAWIDQYYPGTKLGITEWKWYAETTMNGALAIADVLGIYGREGVYLANYWTNPPLNSPGLEAFKLYRNYDGNHGTFGDVSVAATSSAPDKLAVYASEDTATHQVKIMVLNKAPQEQMATSLAVQGAALGGSAKVYQLSEATNLTIAPQPDVPVSGGSLTYTFPAYSATLLVIDKGP